ncbi:MAG: hypothetical protein ACRETA_11190 [Gammaproteobacteria bacterium]
MNKQTGIKALLHKTISVAGSYLALGSVMLAAACSTTNPAGPSQIPVVTQNGAVVNYTLPGNLAPKHKVGCVSLGNASDTWTPADVFPAMRTCIDRGSYTNAVELFTLASSYGQFDMARVMDHSAWNALQVLQMQYMKDVTPAQKSGFNQAAQAMLQNRSDICMQLEKLGPPNYVPTYMLEHGMAAFTGTSKNGGLVENFNAQSVWALVLHDYAHCT